MIVKRIYAYTDFFVGQKLPELIGQPDHNIIDYSGNSVILLMVLNSPTENELEQLASNRKEIRIKMIGPIMWFTFKFGSLNWSEAPYSPHLSTQVNMPEVLDIASRSLRIVLVDSVNGTVRYCCSVKPSKAFIGLMKSNICNLLQMDFDKSLYDRMLMLVQNTNTTEQIAEDSEIRSSLRTRRFFS